MNKVNKVSTKLPSSNGTNRQTLCSIYNESLNDGRAFLSCPSMMNLRSSAKAPSRKNDPPICDDRSCDHRNTGDPPDLLQQAHGTNTAQLSNDSSELDSDESLFEHNHSDVIMDEPYDYILIMHASADEEFS